MILRKGRLCRAFIRHAWIFILLVACSQDNPAGRSDEAGASPAMTVKEADNGRVSWPESGPGERIQIDAQQLSGAEVVRLTPDLVLGTGQRGIDDEFGVVGGVAVDTIGRIYIWDTQSFRIRVYQPEGTFVRDIGRRGSGPGEFTHPIGMWEFKPLNGITISNDTLFAIDIKLQAFDTAGTFLVSSGGELPVYNTNSITATPGGLVGVFGDLATHRFITFDFRRNVAITDSFVVHQYFHDYGDQMQRGVVPHTSIPHSVSRNGLTYFIVGDSFHVDARRANGRIARSFHAVAPRVPLRDSDRADFIEAMVGEMRRLMPGQSDAAIKSVERSTTRMYSMRPYARHRQTVSVIIASETGSMLLARPDLTARPYRRSVTGDHTVWTHIDPDGRVLPHVELPNRFFPKLFERCYLYGILTQDDGIEAVVRYDLTKAGCTK